MGIYYLTAPNWFSLIHRQQQISWYVMLNEKVGTVQASE